VEVRYSAIRHPQSNSIEWCWRHFKILQDLLSPTIPELGNFLPHIENWLNHTIASYTGYASMEQMFDIGNPGLFDKLAQNLFEYMQPLEDINSNIRRVYEIIQKDGIRN
jgi:hypothetical protein